MSEGDNMNQSNEAEHTPTPWSIVPKRPHQHKSVIQRQDGNVVAVCGWEGGMEMDEKNAEFIVRCVNSHAALLQAVKTALIAMQAGGYNRIELESIKAAIANAETK